MPEAFYRFRFLFAIGCGVSDPFGWLRFESDDAILFARCGDEGAGGGVASGVTSTFPAPSPAALLIFVLKISCCRLFYGE